MIENDLKEPLLNTENTIQNNNNNYLELNKKFELLFSLRRKTEEQIKIFYEYFKSTSNLINILNINPIKGLNMKDYEDIRKRKNFFNSYQNPISFCKKDYLSFLKIAFTDQLLIDLIEGSIVGGIIGSFKDGFLLGWNDSIAIMISVTIVAMFSAFSNYQKQNKFLHLFSEINNKNCIVKRNGELISININHLLTGDILIIQEGDEINVNGILLKGQIKCIKTIYKNNIKESKEIEFSDDNNKNNFIINSNSYNPLKIISGEGEILVILTSNKYADYNKFLQYNKDNIISQYLNQENIDEDYFEEDKLNNQIHLLSEQIGNLGVIIGYIVGIIMLIKFFSYNYYLGNYNLMFSLINILEVLVDVYIITEALKVALIPEGLPMAMALSISSNIDPMIKDKILINHLNKINDITLMNYLILNKEILTENTMEIKEIYIFNKKIEKYQDKNILEKLFDDIIYNSISKVITLDGKKIINKNCKNNEADICLVNYFLENFYKKFNLNLDNKIKENIVFRNFNSDKFQLSIIKNSNNENKYKALIKGDKENIFSFCNKYIDSDENIKEIDEAYKKKIKKLSKFDILYILAEKECNSIEINGNEFFKDFIIKGLFLIDNITIDISQNINRIHNCGINTFLITKDTLKNTINICEKSNLITEKDGKIILDNLKDELNIKKGLINFKNIIKLSNKHLLKGMKMNKFIKEIGGSYEKINDKKYKYVLTKMINFKECLSNIKFISDCTNNFEKNIFIHGLHQIGKMNKINNENNKDNYLNINKENVVGFLYNDLYDSNMNSKSLADISFNTNKSYNISTNHGDVILLKSNLNTLINTIYYCRNILDNLRKFIQFQLTVCFVTIVFVTIGNFYFLESILTSVQLLWINILMDSLAALALTSDLWEKEQLLNYSPYSGHLFNKAMILNIGLQFIYQLTVLFIFLIYGSNILNVPNDQFLSNKNFNNTNGYHINFIFNLFIYLTIGNLFNCRTVHLKDYNVFKGINKNQYFLKIVIIYLLLQTLLCYFGGAILRTHLMSIYQHLLCLFFGILGIFINFLGKLLSYDDEIFLGEDNKENKKINLIRKKFRKKRSII